MPVDAAMLRVIDELRELTLNMFFSCLNNSVQRLLEKVIKVLTVLEVNKLMINVFFYQIETPGLELKPVQGFHQVLLLLRDVLESHDSTLVPVTDKKDNFAKVLLFCRTF